ncbi:MAG: hypothetical protein CMD79_04925 [Gammaproteobacteria bacterium]|nr:hypothetical protein [Gammaproteobacteria bacterium]|tara:strand:- start:892 stop:1296 length:405 start_codon:yes stop_codon:yes gene_type:complete
MDFIKIKKIIILVLALPVLFLIGSSISTFINQPDIKDINIPDMTDFSFASTQGSLEDNSKNIQNIPSFDYKVIGYRSGEIDSSVILKKGNKEFVVAKGEKLEGVYELIKVSKDEVIFRNQEKLYKIENLVGNNL